MNVLVAFGLGLVLLAGIALWHFGYSALLEWGMKQP